MSEETKVALSDQSFMIGKYIMFFEDLKPRDTLFIERSVYEVKSLKGSQRMLIEWKKTSPGATEYKTRTGCLPGNHIAVITDSMEKALQIVEIVTKLSKSVDELSDFATNAIKGLSYHNKNDAELVRTRVRPTSEVEQVRTRTRVA